MLPTGPTPSFPSPTDLTRVVMPFIGRRLRAVWRMPDTDGQIGDVWLEFHPRSGAPHLLRLSAKHCLVLPAYVSGGGPTAWTLQIHAETGPAPQGLVPWPILTEQLAHGHAGCDWALTGFWASAVPDNVLCPGACWVQEVCGGIALHFSNSKSPNYYGGLLGAHYEHHDMDAPHAYFCAETLPPLAGSGAWQQLLRLDHCPQRDDADVCHYDHSGFGGPALAGCLNQLNTALLGFLNGFEKAPGLLAWRSQATRSWYARHIKLLYDAQLRLAYADIENICDPEGGQTLRGDIATFGLGTLFADAWHERDAALPDEPVDSPGTPPNTGTLKDIRRHYAPVREAYRQWFLLHRQACIAAQRIKAQKVDESVPPWVLSLDAALTRGSVRFDELSACPTARARRDDFREPWAPFEELDWVMRHGGIRPSGPQDVWIEGDEERGDYLRITWWPLLERRDQIIVWRVEFDALQRWWAMHADQLRPSTFETVLAWQQGRTPVAETWPTFASIAKRVLQPPGLDASHLKDDADGDAALPPYSLDDIRWVAHQHMQGRPTAHWLQVRAADPELVWTFDSSHRRVPLMVGRDIHPLMTIDSGHRAAERVLFPAVWPAWLIGQDPFKPFYLMWSRSNWREERIQGRAYRNENWLLPVQRWVPLTDSADGPHGWRWGVIDVDGRFVLPCMYPAMGFPQSKGIGTPIQPEQALHPGRQQPWCWVWVGDEPVSDTLHNTARSAATGDVIEVWSGQRLNADEECVVQLANQFALACRRADLTGAKPRAIGLRNLATGKAGDICWQSINTFALSVTHAATAQCVETGLWSYLDENGHTLLDTRFARAGQIDRGLAIVQLTLVQARIEGRVVTLPDGAAQGGVGVFGPHGAPSLGQWILMPQWREVLGEYDGHFVVQDSQGRWGMVTPEGEAVTAFLLRHDRDDVSGDVLQQVIQQFKRTQIRRFKGWMQEARAQGSLVVMAGKLHSAFGAYDYGAMPSMQVAVRLTRDLPAAPPPPYDQVPLHAGAEFVWRPGQRNYFHTVDLRTHTMIGPAAADGGSDWGGYHGIAVPWDALALAPPEPDCGTEDDQRTLQLLNADAHGSALTALMDALDQLADHLDGEGAHTYSEGQSACRKLWTLCVRLDQLQYLCEPRSRRDILLGYMQHELDAIDFPAVLSRLSAPDQALQRAGDAYQTWVLTF